LTHLSAGAYRALIISRPGNELVATRKTHADDPSGRDLRHCAPRLFGLHRLPPEDRQFRINARPCAVNAYVSQKDYDRGSGEGKSRVVDLSSSAHCRKRISTCVLNVAHRSKRALRRRASKPVCSRALQARRGCPHFDANCLVRCAEKVAGLARDVGGVPRQRIAGKGLSPDRQGARHIQILTCGAPIHPGGRGGPGICIKPLLRCRRMGRLARERCPNHHVPIAVAATFSSSVMAETGDASTAYRARMGEDRAIPRTGMRPPSQYAAIPQRPAPRLFGRLLGGQYRFGDRARSGDVIHRRPVSPLAVAAADGIDDLRHLCRSFDAAPLRLDRHRT